nr:CP [Ornithogalum mosaic virus]
AESMDAGGSSRPPAPLVRQQDQDVNVGTFSVARVKALSDKMMLPKVRGRTVLNLQHLVQYNPEQVEISNTRATRTQFNNWYDKVRDNYGVTDDQMTVILNGLMVWCIENGTSPNLNGNWTMMDGDEQVEYPLQPILENAQPTFRQIMAHFSNAAEAYIEKRNSEQRYMPRYGSQRNLNDYSLARYAFDFYELTSRTPNRAREAHIQMKAAALRNTKTKLFGLDGKVGTEEEDTERHVASDVNRNMHSLLGVNM